MADVSKGEKGSVDIRMNILKSPIGGKLTSAQEQKIADLKNASRPGFTAADALRMFEEPEDDMPANAELRRIGDLLERIANALEKMWKDGAPWMK